MEFIQPAPVLGRARRMRRFALTTGLRRRRLGPCDMTFHANPSPPNPPLEGEGLKASRLVSSEMMSYRHRLASALPWRRPASALPFKPFLSLPKEGGSGGYRARRHSDRLPRAPRSAYREGDFTTHPSS